MQSDLQGDLANFALAQQPVSIIQDAHLGVGDRLARREQGLHRLAGFGGGSLRWETSVTASTSSVCTGPSMPPWVTANTFSAMA